MIYIDKKAAIENEMPWRGMHPTPEGRMPENFAHRGEGSRETAGNIQIILFTEEEE